MKKKVRTPESNQFHNFEEGVVSFYDKLEKNYVNTGEVVLYFFKTAQNDKEKVCETKMHWTDKINAISVSARRIEDRCHWTVKSVDNGSVIVLKSPSQAFDSKGKSQKKLMQKHLCVIKNCEVIDSCFNQKCEDIDLCYYFGKQAPDNLLQTMISGFALSEKKTNDVCGKRNCWRRCPACT